MSAQLWAHHLGAFVLRVCQCRGTPGAIMAAILLSSAPQAGAAKVVMLYDAWPEAAHAFRIIGGWNGISWQGPESSAGDLRREGPWYVKQLPATWSATAGTNDIAFSTSDWRAKYGAKGFGDQSDIDIAPYLTASDTVWIVPSPMPNGPPRLSGTRPRQAVLMFLDPWSTPGSVQIEAGPWRKLKPAATHPGWTTTHLMGFTSLSLLLRSPDSSTFFGAAGLTPLPVPFLADSLAYADTLWIRPAHDTAGPPVATARRPRGKVIMFLNPWGGTRPVRQPAISWEGSRLSSMEPSAEHCGWYRKEAYARAPQVLFRNSAGASYGALGTSGGSAIDLASAFAAHDTAWIVPDPVSGLPVVRPRYTGETGMCTFSLLAATVRDFDTTHPDFEKGWSGVKKGMVLPTLDAHRKPIKNPSVHYVVTGGSHVGDTISRRIGIDWFHTNPATNAETCRDIPLALDTSSGSYVYDNPHFYPIDDFTTLDDGSPNPRRNILTGSDGKPHNYGFCLESHGEFDYRKGQVFRFRGDDDVWFFIDGNLVVDLGGVHGPSRDSVLLDQIGWRYVKRTVGGVTVTDTLRDSLRTPLVDGRTYNFDFFFCERQSGGSSILIQTDMNMRTRSGFQVRDSLLGPGRVAHDLWVSQTSGQGCKAQMQVTRTTGRFVLRGDKIPSTPLVSGRLHYGGIDLDALGFSATIDSTKLVGLAPGNYRLVAISTLDSTAVVEIPFTVPSPPIRDKGLRFLDDRGVPLAPGPWTGLPGDTLRLRFETFSGNGTCTTCGTRVVVTASAQALQVGDAPSGESDTVDLIGGRGTVVVGGFAPVSGASIVVRVLEDSASSATWSPLAVAVFPPDSASVHDDNGDGRADRLSIRLHQRWNASNQVALRWPDTSTTILGDAVVGADSLQIRMTIETTTEATAPGAGASGIWKWSPTDPALPFSVADRIPAKVRRAVLSRGSSDAPDTLHLLLTESVTMASSEPAIEVRSGGRWTSLATTDAGSSSNRMTLLVPNTMGPTRGDSVRTAPGSTLDAGGNTPSTNALGAPVEVAAAAPSGGWALDRDGDGAIDLVRVIHPEPVDTSLPGSFEFTFQTSSGPLSRRGLKPRRVSGRNDLLDVELEHPLPRGTTSFILASGAIRRDGLPSLEGGTSREDHFALLDSAAPVVLTARILLTESYDAPDTLVVVGSERLQDAAWSFLVLPIRGTEIHATPAGGSLRRGDTLRVLLPPDETPWICAGDSLRWAPDGTVRDTSGTGASPLAPRVVVTGNVRPPLLRLVSPRTMNRFPVEETPSGFVPGIQILGGSGDHLLVIDPATASPSPDRPCPLERCTGPELELNRPARVAVVVYDLLGTHVTGTEVVVDERMLEALGMDRLGRARLSLRWDLADASGRPVADGVYLMRLVLRGTTVDASQTMINQVWKLGVHRVRP